MKLTSKKFSLLVLFFFTLIPISTYATKQLPIIPLQQSIASTKNYVKGEVIIKYKDQKNINSLNFLSLDKKTKDSLKVQDDFKNVNIAVLKSETKSTKELMEELSESDNIEYVEPNYIKQFFWTPNDTYFNDYQWAHYNDGTDGTTDADIDTTEMWDIENNNATSTIIAVIDSGVHYTAQDIAQNMWNGTGCVDDTNTPISGGCPYHGWDYIDNDNNPDDTTNSNNGHQGHGTFITSILSSTINNTEGVAGTSRYNTIKTMAVRFDLTVSEEIKAINFAKYNGAKVINASFGGESFSQSEKDAIDAFGGIFVASSGNGGSDEIGDNNDTTPIYPCNYTSENIICVGASDSDDHLTSFSNYGATSVDLVAPGEDIIGFGYLNNSWQYAIGAGTSFATPYTAGVSAILYAHNNALTQTQVKDLILDNVDDLSLSSKIATGGRLNANKSLLDLSNNIGFDIAPTRFDRSPAPNTPLMQNTTGAVISLHTNIDATCKYSTIPNQSYDAMPYIMTSESSGTYHSHMVSGFTNGSTYTYYVKCSSTATHAKNSTDYAISFTVGYPTTAIYRLYNTKNGTQLYTRGEEDKNKILSKYPDFEFTDGAPAFYTSLTQQSTLTPMYRLYNTKNGAQLYTRGEEDKNKILSKYPDFEFTDGTPAFYASLIQQLDLTPIYRLYNTRTGMQLYTRGEADKNKILSKYPDFEFTDGAPAFYASLTN